ncbi:hypothetical protein GOP47_0000548 [Adiantum capillus-veneris]|uniref:Uncharacterized protein n=1 Tax=Adiantum capillus-veneris TaxID=13818 RepID=A0A9D4VE37_ADICA|nr:hypothetical protein GOP47_0000548 [Adiantum capillus-veneris]
MLLRSASICSKWRQHAEVLLLARLLSASPSPENEDLNLTELTQQSSASNTESRFGISPRKVKDEEDEDFVPPTPPPAAADFPKPQNYFSKTWAMQKRIITGESVIIEEGLPPPSQPSRAPQFIVTTRSALKRTWQVASDCMRNKELQPSQQDKCKI